MQCNVDRKLPEEDVILKDPPLPHESPLQRNTRRGGDGGSAPPRTPLMHSSLTIIDGNKACKLDRRRM